MFIYRSIVNEDATLIYKPDTGEERHAAIVNIDQHHMNHFNLWGIPDDPAVFARWYNTLQRYVIENTRLGIPVTIASDPRHHFSNSIFSFNAQGFSQFPEPLGFAAIGDMELVQRFANIVREEYLAIGIRLALHPQIDLATEPRWARISGGFGDDAHLTAAIAARYVRGLQGEELSPNSVATMVKHFPGGGPQQDGLDPHFPFQEGQVYPGGQFDYHLIPFAAAIEAGAASIMPYYGVPLGQTNEDVAMAFNRDIITGLLRDKFQFNGVVCTDWGVISDIHIGDVLWPARAWGVESLSEVERVKRALDAGVDQFGGERSPEHVATLVESGQVSEARIDESVRRILRQKFSLGLFDDPFVAVDRVNERVGRIAARQLGHDSQKRAMTLLKNGVVDNKSLLPLARFTLKVYVQGADPAPFKSYAAIVDDPEEADFAIVRLNTPWYPVATENPIARTFHHGDLDFKNPEKTAILNLAATVPTIVVLYLDRPAVIPDIVANAAAVIADYGASDKAVAEVLFGVGRPEGHLPFELPSSMQAVRDQFEDVPSDSKNPLFPRGHGLTYHWPVPGDQIPGNPIEPPPHDRLADRRPITAAKTPTTAPTPP
jgi:beta-glucosidase